MAVQHEPALDGVYASVELQLFEDTTVTGVEAHKGESGMIHMEVNFGSWRQRFRLTGSQQQLDELLGAMAHALLKAARP